MSNKPLTRVPPTGRRATILRQTIDDFRTLEEVANAVRAAGATRVNDRKIDERKTHGAVKDLHRRGLLTKTPWGLRCTAAGMTVLANSEARS